MRSGPATQTAFACVNLTAAPARAHLPASEENQLSATVAHPHSKVQLHPHRACRSQSRHARPFLRRPQRPGARNAFTFGNLSAIHLSAAPGTDLSACPARSPDNCRRTNLRDHWRRVIHACSDCTFSYCENFINENSRPRCAKTVDDQSCLWKPAENLETIGPYRKGKQESLPPPGIYFTATCECEAETAP